MNSEYRDIIRNHQKSAPVHVVPLAQELGLSVYKIDSFPDDLSGMIKKESDNKYSIYVNGNHHIHRRRFTIAHEIAHFLLHKNHIGDGIVDNAMYRSGLSSALESQANAMAADILMPWHLLNQEDTKSGFAIPLLAIKFLVSEASMAIRLGVPVEPYY